MSQKFIPATGKQVRAWFAQNPDKVPAGAEVSTRPDCKGLIKGTAVEVFNKNAKTHGMKYEPGNEATMPLTYKAKNHRMVTVHLPKSEVRAMAGKSGVRGPLSKKDIDFATEVYLSRV